MHGWVSKSIAVAGAVTILIALMFLLNAFGIKINETRDLNNNSNVEVSPFK